MKKAFAAVLLAGLAALCVGETYEVTFKPFPCDFTQNTTTTTQDGETTVITKYHGNFLIQNSTTVGITLVRPDLGVDPDGKIFEAHVSNMESECTTNNREPAGNLGTVVFEHKEEDTLDGKSCFKYYKTTNSIFWADAEGNLLAKETSDETSRMFVTVVAEATEFPRETFVLPEGYKCTEKPEVFQAPAEEAYATACPAPAPSSTSSSVQPSSSTTSSVQPSSSTSSSVQPSSSTSSSVQPSSSTTSSTPASEPSTSSSSTPTPVPSSSSTPAPVTSSSSAPHHSPSSSNAVSMHGLSVLAVLCAAVMAILL